ncbi:MAG: hypothetical protein RLZZ440_2657 [Planctomycetota bacterium]
MKKRRRTEQIVGLLHQADVDLGMGTNVPDVCRRLGISQQTYYRWRTEFGGMDPKMAKQLQELQKENLRLEKLVNQEGRRRPCKRCCSSITTSARCRNAAAFVTSACVPTTMLAVLGPQSSRHAPSDCDFPAHGAARCAARALRSDGVEPNRSVLRVVCGRLHPPSTRRSVHGRRGHRDSLAAPPPTTWRPRAVTTLRASPPREDPTPQDRVGEPRELA